MNPQSSINQSELDEILDMYFQDRTLDFIKQKTGIGKIGVEPEPAEFFAKAKRSLIALIEAEKQSLLDELETVVTHEYTGGTALEPVEYLTIPKQFIASHRTKTPEQTEEKI